MTEETNTKSQPALVQPSCLKTQVSTTLQHSTSMTRSGTGFFNPDRSHEMDPDSNLKPREYLFPPHQMGGIYQNIEKVDETKEEGFSSNNLEEEYSQFKVSQAQFSQVSQNSKAMSCFQAVIAAASQSNSNYQAHFEADDESEGDF